MKFSSYSILKSRKKFLTLLVLLGLFTSNAFATRMGQFSGVGLNTLTKAPGPSAAQSYSATCSLEITNGSSKSQDVKLFMIATSNDANHGTQNATWDTTNYGPKVVGTSTFAGSLGTYNGSATAGTSGTILAGDTLIFLFTFQALNNQTDLINQTVLCKGTITVDDTSAGQLGFISASGGLNLFLQAGSSLGGGSHTGGITGEAVFSNMPFSVAKGKPF